MPSFFDRCVVTRVAGASAALLFFAQVIVAPAIAAPAGCDGIVQRIVDLRASDGQRVPGVLMTPAAGIDPYSPAVVLLHGGPFGHPIRTQSAARFVAEGLACRGYTTLSILSRHAGGYYLTPLADGSRDIAAAVDWLEASGVHDVVLAGHSFGSVRMTLYLVDSGDARVKALIHYAPTRGSKEYVPSTFPPGGYERVVAKMRALVADGRGDEPTYVEFNYPPPAPAGARFGYIMTAANWLDWWGPESVAQNLELIPRVRVPMLMITGSSDLFVPAEYQERLKRAAIASSRVDTRLYEGTGHELSGAEARAVDDTAKWLESVGLGVRPRIRTRLVDVEVEAGRTAYGRLFNAGVVYEPADSLRVRGPAVLLTYDRREDVLTGRYEALAPRLAQRGFRVLVPQDRTYALNADRVAPSASDDDVAAWIQWLGQGSSGARVALVGPGSGAERLAGYLARRGAGHVAGLVVLAPEEDASRTVRAAVGDAGYDELVARARAAPQQGLGDRTLIAARGTDGSVAVHQLAGAFLAQAGPEHVTPERLLPDVKVPILWRPGTALGERGRNDPCARVVRCESQGGSTDPDTVAAAIDRWLASLPADAPAGRQHADTR